jgi:hypothetical protein
VGQYYLICNPKKRQYLRPHAFGSGMKLMEFANDECGPLLGLAVLLADGNGRGGGDLRLDDIPEKVGRHKLRPGLVGSWAGDPIVIDYADRGNHMIGLEGIAEEVLEKVRGEYEEEDRAEIQTLNNVNLYTAARVAFEDISDDVIRLVGAAEGRHGHPWSRMDLSDDGWRRRPAWGDEPVNA